MSDPRLARTDWLSEANEALALARIAHGQGDRAVYRDALMRAGVLAVLMIASSVSSMADTRDDAASAAEARAWSDGYGTGRTDEAGALPMDPRAT